MKKTLVIVLIAAALTAADFGKAAAETADEAAWAAEKAALCAARDALYESLIVVAEAYNAYEATQDPYYAAGVPFLLDQEIAGWEAADYEAAWVKFIAAGVAHDAAYADYRAAHDTYEAALASFDAAKAAAPAHYWVDGMPYLTTEAAAEVARALGAGD